MFCNARQQAGANLNSALIKSLEAKHSLFELAFVARERQDGSGGKDFRI